VTPLPVRWVINTGSQDHRWLGNGHFAAQGAQIIALARTVATQQELGAQWLAMLRPALKERLDGTVPAYAAQPIAADRQSFVLGGRRFELFWPGDAHFAGDYLDWLVAEVSRAVAEWEPLEATVSRLADAPRFRHLGLYVLLHRPNINRA